MASVAIIYHSGYGHTKVIAESLHKGVASVAGVNATLISVADIEQHWDTLAKADALVFGAPTYMGSASAEFKKFMEASAKVWFTQGWKDKLAAGFTVSGAYSGDKLATLQLFMIFAGQHTMLWVPLGIMPGFNTSKASIDDLNRVGSYSGLMVQANLDQGPEGIAASDFKTAEAYGERIATRAKKHAG